MYRKYSVFMEWIVYRKLEWYQDRTLNISIQNVFQYKMTQLGSYQPVLQCLLIT